MRNDFRIAIGSEAVSLPFELFAQLGVVVYFAIVNDRVPVARSDATAAGKRLCAVRRIENSEPGMTKMDVARGVFPTPIGTTMDVSVNHALQHTR